MHFLRSFSPPEYLRDIKKAPGSLWWLCIAADWKACREHAVLTAPPRCFAAVFLRSAGSSWCWSLPVLQGTNLPSDCAAALWRMTHRAEPHAYSMPGEPGNKVVNIREDKREEEKVCWVRLAKLKSFQLNPTWTRSQSWQLLMSYTL